MTDKILDFSKLKIWVVEDDSPSISLIQRLLNALGVIHYSVTTKIEPVVEAMEAGVEIDVLLIDVHLNKDSGYDLLTQIQQDLRYTGTKNIMLSATSGPIGVRQAQQAHADGFITKPLTIDKLQRAFIAVLENKNFWE